MYCFVLGFMVGVNMEYLLDVYVKIYMLICSEGSWLITLFILVFLAAPALMNDSQYKKQILYWYIVAFVGTVLFKIICWVILPSPTFLGLI